MALNEGTITLNNDVLDGDSVRVAITGSDVTYEFKLGGGDVQPGNVAVPTNAAPELACGNLALAILNNQPDYVTIDRSDNTLVLAAKDGFEWIALADSDNTDARIVTELLEQPIPATATYDPALPTLKDSIRLALGDTDMTEPLLLDATILAKLGLFPYNEALAQLAEALIAEFGQKPDEYSEDRGIRLKWTQRMNAWQRVIDAARSGQIMAPTATRTSRAAGAVGQLNTPSMTGFRSD